VGSLTSRKWLVQTRRAWLPLSLIVAGLLVYVFVLPAVLNLLVGLPFAMKLGISGVLLVPLGLAMGMPFPTGLRALANFGPDNANSIEWAWAMNAASSVLGSVLAMVIAIEFGLTLTLACAALAYLVEIGLLPTIHRRLA
jgi:hypothetical protein